MAITQPGDVTVIAPVAVQNDANYVARAETILGGFVALPSGSGPPTTATIPLVMRRVGALAYTPADNKWWQLIGGTADANWVQQSLVAAVLSVFGRTGAVVATAGDYTSSQITNASAVTGATVTAALNALNAALATAGPVSSVFGRTGSVVAVLNDYTSSLIQNLATVTGGGSTVTSALNALQAQISASVTGVSSWNSRTGAVAPASGDYAASQVTNDSSVVGTGVKGALNTLLASIAALVTGVSSVYGRTGAVTATSGDYNSSQVTNSSGVSGTGVTGALNTLNTTIGALVTGVSSVYGRAGAVVAVAGDYAASKINNDSATVTGTHVSDALDALKALIAASVTGVSSVYGRTGAVVAATNDYTDLQIQNTSSVSGTGVKGALNTLLASIGALVTGVSSVYGRAGAVVAVSGDYTSTQVTNSSSVTGTGVTGALNTLGTAVSALNQQYASVVTTSLSSVTLGLTNIKGLFLVSGTAGSPTAFTVPLHATVAFPIGSQIDFIALNANNFTITGATGAVTIRTPVGNLAATNSLYHLIYIDTDLWELTQVPVDSTHLTNASSVSGTTVSDALNTLLNKVVTSRWAPLIAGFPQTYWSFNAGIGILSTGSGGSGTFRVPLGPFGSNDLIAGVAVVFKAAGGHGSLPATMPALRLYIGSTTGSSVAALATASDPSASTGAYQVVHSWTATIGGGPVSAASNNFWAEFDDESGVGASLGGILIGVAAVLA